MACIIRNMDPNGQLHPLEKEQYDQAYANEVRRSQPKSVYFIPQSFVGIPDLNPYDTVRFTSTVLYELKEYIEDFNEPYIFIRNREDGWSECIGRKGGRFQIQSNIACIKIRGTEYL